MSVFPYGLFAAAGVGCMLIAMLLTAPKRSFSKGTVTVFGLLAIPLSLVFSRLLYCVFQLNLFCDTYENPWLMLCIWDGGYSIWGVIPALLLAAWLTAKMQRCSFRSLWDCVSLSSALLFAMLYAGEGRTEPWHRQGDRCGVPHVCIPISGSGTKAGSERGVSPDRLPAAMPCMRRIVSRHAAFPAQIEGGRNFGASFLVDFCIHADFLGKSPG